MAGSGEGPAWGIELWDCEKEICSTCEEGANFVALTREFVKERAKLEQSFARELAKLLESHKDKFKAVQLKTPKDASTAIVAWDTILTEEGHIVKQHDAIAENLTKHVSEPMKLLIKSKKAEREGHTKRLAKLQKDSDKAEKAFDTKRTAWEKSTKERVEAQQKAETARNDVTMAPIKVKKLDLDVTALESKEAAAKAEYDIARANVEKFRRKLYTEDLKKIFNDMQRMEMEREQTHADQLVAYARAFSSVHETVGSCVEGMAKAAASISCTEDSKRFVGRTKTGNPPEMKITAATSTKKMLTAQQVNQKRVTKKKVFKTTSRKKDAIREDLGHLPPQQRERAFLERLELTNSARDRELKAKVGFEKTIEAYTANPAMGDKKSMVKLQAELEASKKKLADLDMEITKLTLYLEAFKNSKDMPTQSGENAEGNAGEEEDWDDDDDDDNDDDDDDEDGGAGTPPRGNVDDDSSNDSASRILSTNSASSSTASLPAPPPISTAAADNASPAVAVKSSSPLSSTTKGPSMSSLSRGLSAEKLPPSPPPPTPPPPAGRRVSETMYAFEGSGNGEISVRAGERVTVTEEDTTASGWVRVLSSSGIEGYIPTSYVK